MTLSRLALARGTLDRAAHLRAEAGQGGGFADRPDRAVVVMAGDRLLILASDQDMPRLMLAAQLDLDVDHLLVFLGQDDERPYWAVLYPAEVTAEAPAEVPETGGAGPGGPGRPGGPVRDFDPARMRWASLREIGALLDDEHAGLATTAVALAIWHRTHRFCPHCGGLTATASSGWSRVCGRCAVEHFPRTDPAVIMAVVDDQGAILLGRQSNWPERRYSTLAGFVEVGESLEAAVRREVLEEAGITVGAVTYLGSQPWPFPRSLMLGFTATAHSTAVAVDGIELAEAHWFSRDQFTKDVASGELLLPPAISISHRLIEHWYGAELPPMPDW